MNIPNKSTIVNLGSAKSQDVTFADNCLLRVQLTCVQEDGLLRVVEPASGVEFCCEVIESLAWAGELASGDWLLALAPGTSVCGCVVGRIGRFSGARPAPERQVIEATGELRLKCGASSIDLRADGKVMIRGEDVLIRAKGSQRIRAGTVSIN